MRKLILVVLFMILTMSMLFGEGLGINAQIIKKMSPEGYEIIRAMAVDYWDGYGSDHEYVIMEINEQSDSLVEVIELFTADDGNPMIFINAVLVRSAKDAGARNMNIIDSWIETGDFSNVFMLTVDWSMVLYEYRMAVASSY